MLTFVPIEEIEEMEKTMEGAAFNKAKEILAYELTALVHGEEEAKKALEAAKAVFAGGGNSENMPTTELTADQLTDGAMNILEMMLAAKLIPTKSEGRRLVQQGGVSVNGEKVTDPNAMIAVDGEVIIKKGKKVFHKVVVA
jgi:tyrosyl-tRNA synthetase